MSDDAGGLDVQCKRFRLVKWDGAPPEPGEEKEPLEIIEGGDGLETRVVFRRDGSRDVSA